MKMIVDKYGDIILTIIAGVLFLAFLMSFFDKNGMVYQVIQGYEAAICFCLPYGKGVV